MSEDSFRRNKGLAAVGYGMKIGYLIGAAFILGLLMGAFLL